MENVLVTQAGWGTWRFEPGSLLEAAPAPPDRMWVPSFAVVPVSPHRGLLGGSSGEYQAWNTSGNLF